MTPADFAAWADGVLRGLAIVALLIWIRNNAGARRRGWRGPPGDAPPPRGGSGVSRPAPGAPQGPPPHRRSVGL